jgi:hypothetical protein
VGKKEHVMKAIAIDDFGPPPSLHDLPVPEPGEGEVLVRVRASSVNGFDVAVVGGHLKGMTEHHFPVVLGKDFRHPREAGHQRAMTAAWRHPATAFTATMAARVLT